jgi:hypothetical protein
MSASRGSSARRLGTTVFFLGIASVLGGALASCGEERPGGAPRRPDGGSGDDGGLHVGDAGGPPPPDAGGLCGNQIHQLINDTPNIYFLLDASGSMSAEAPGNTTRYERVQEAAVDLVRNLGPLINVGAAVFPLDASSGDSCHAGGEVLAVRPGDPYVEGQSTGPTTKAFRSAISLVPYGGTPTAATLEGLTPALLDLSGRTIVVLATDGGPNCNFEAECPPEECMPYVEGQCDASCCEPSGAAGPSSCVDRAATVAAVAALADAGIDVYVIGIPGSELYGGVLDDMALAGGAPQFVSPFYYKVDNLDTLGSVLAEIAAVVISCEFDVQDAPPEEGKTNVYLDQEIVPYSETSGWRWKTETVVELVGEACQRVKSGKVRQVQIVSGCPTEVAE